MSHGFLYYTVNTFIEGHINFMGFCNQQILYISLRKLCFLKLIYTKAAKGSRNDQTNIPNPYSLTSVHTQSPDDRLARQSLFIPASLLLLAPIIPLS